MNSRHSTAIVLGASISGLLAARALSGHFGRVIVVDRDRLPGGAETRSGVPQSAHAHGLLASGYRVMDRYFPGMMEELNRLGAPFSDVTEDFLWFQYGHWKLRFDSGLRGITVSRPCLESAIRRRVKELPNIIFLEGTEGIAPVFDGRAGQVTGLIVRRRDRNDEEQLAGDLVVDATGKGSRSARWLERWGFEQAETLVLKVNVGYATRIFVSSSAHPEESYRVLRLKIPGMPLSSPLKATGGSSHWSVRWETIRRRLSKNGSHLPKACRFQRSMISYARHER